MKISKLKYFFPFLILVFLIACSTKKDRFINREFQALNTKYNVMYNGNIALDKGIEELKLKYTDNFWEILPIERMQVSDEELLPSKDKNANFDRAEEKATKAIQKRSMNIDGKEKNPQMDEAHLLLGKARYYDHRFVPALEAFNYILYKYPESDKIYEAKIWRERTNMRMENDALAIKNLRKLLSEIKFKNQVFADANATLAQAFLNLEQKDSAISRLKLAIEFTKQNEEKARYHFILGQIFEQSGDKENAAASYQSVIDMKRKSPRRYVLQAQNKLAQEFDFEKGDTTAFIKQYNKLLEDRENRSYLDILNHQMGLFYDKQNKHKQAIKFYNKSLRTKSEDQYLMASNYRNLADIYFDDAKYQTAGKYYDSTLVRLKARTRENKYIKKKLENLADVIKYEGIAQVNDSILNVVSLPESDKKRFYEDYITRLKKSDIAKAEVLKIEQKRLASQQDNTNDDDFPQQPLTRNPGNDPRIKALDRSDIINTQTINPSDKDKNLFYFYNTSTVAFGKIEYKKKWGTRPLKNYWRLSSLKDNIDDKKTNNEKNNDSISEQVTKVETEPKYTPDFYLQQLPTSQKKLDDLAKERDFAYYQLGIIYKEKFKEYKLAAAKLEQLLKNKPEERLVLPSMYNLFKIYEIIDKDKAEAMKRDIIIQYPESRYAQILNNQVTGQDLVDQSPETVYQSLFNLYEKGDYIKVLGAIEEAINQFTGEEIIPKMELLKANTIGKLKGLAEYKTALNFVALNYPSSEEGKSAEKILSENVLKLEKLQFNTEKPLSWKIIYKISNIENPKTKDIQSKIVKFVSERTSEKLTTSVDIYNMKENFIVIHGIGSEENAKGIATILKDYKDYNISEPAIVVSNENYKIIQIKKNLPDYLTAPNKGVITSDPLNPSATEKGSPKTEKTPSVKEPGLKANDLNADDPNETEKSPQAKESKGKMESKSDILNSEDPIVPEKKNSKKP